MGKPRNKDLFGAEILLGANRPAVVVERIGICGTTSVL